MKPFPEHGKCFVCGSENPHGIGMRWFVRDDGSLYGEIALTEYEQGPPGHAHGGATAALLDEAMGLCVWAAGHQVLAVNLNITFKHMVPLHQTITITGWVSGKEGRVVHSVGEIRLPDGMVAVEGKGVYVDVPERFTNSGLHNLGL